MTIESWKESGEYFLYKNQYKIFYRCELTDRPCLLLLHGFPTSSWDFHKIWEGLAKHFNLITLDFIGFGYSDKPINYKYNIQDQVNIVESLLKHLNIGTTTILAHDYAVSVTQELIARQKERELNQFSKAIFLNGGLFPETHHARPIQKLLLSPIGKWVNLLLTKNSLRKSFDKIFGPQTKASAKEIDEFYDLILHNNGKNIFYKLIGYINDRKINSDRWLEAIIKPYIENLLINGPEDPVSGRHLGKRYEELSGKNDVIYLEGIGHYPHTEAPQEVLKHVLNFLL